MYNIENYHNFERTEDRETVFLKWTDFRYLLEKIVKSVAVANYRLHMLSVDFQSWLLFEWSG